MFIAPPNTSQSSSVRSGNLSRVHIALLTERPDDSDSVLQTSRPSGTKPNPQKIGSRLVPHNLQMQFSQLLFVDFTGRIDHQILR